MIQSPFLIGTESREILEYTFEDTNHLNFYYQCRRLRFLFIININHVKHIHFFTPLVRLYVMDLLGGYDSSDGDDDDISEERKGEGTSRSFLGEQQQSIALTSKKSIRRGEDGRVLLTLPVPKTRKLSDSSATGSIEKYKRGPKERDEGEEEEDEGEKEEEEKTMEKRSRVGLIDQLPAPKKPSRLITQDNTTDYDFSDYSIHSHPVRCTSQCSFVLVPFPLPSFVF
jgi:hypothetical protein